MQKQDRIKIHFFFQKKITLKDRKSLKAFLSDFLLRKGRKSSGVVRVIFCSDNDLLEINRDFLQHDYYTDIITFPLTEETAREIEAELYISVDRVKYNAAKGGEELERELHRVIFHGFLHLCGLNDKTETDILKMRKAENSLLSSYFERST